MDLKEIRKESRKMLEAFIETIGLDGEMYSNLNTTPIAWGKPKLGGLGEYVSPQSARLENLISKMKIDDKVKRTLNNKGMILINQSYRNQEPDADLYITLIHETLHANRDLLLFDIFRDGKNESAYSYNNERLEQNTDVYSFRHADSSQEILKGSIDTSRRTVRNYDGKTSEEIEDMEWAEGRIDSKMEKQQIVDEALVELMAVLSYKLYTDKQKGKEPNIWATIQKAKQAYDEDDISVICEIILRHHDFELFNWMLDPIEYSSGDIHYDFFSKYTKNDTDLVNKLYGSSSLDLKQEDELDRDDER